MELLVVEDEPVLGKALHRGLREDGHDVVWTRSGREGLEHARQRNFDVLILDLMLPDLDGFAILRALRGDGLQTPVLVLTALGSVDDRVKGLRDGADDYLVKPFAFPELLARLHALHRRSLTRPAMRLQAGALELDLGSRKVTRGGETVDLSPTEFSILELLMRHAGQTVTRKMLNEHVWGEDWTGETNVIDVHINHLRRKLDREHPQRFIHTVRGQGYVLRTTS
jgi:two-component system OmpR family response regulator/two-component system copper resistance phosphate regulon response regulator CusR